MRVVMTFELPLEPFNSLVRDGSAGRTIESILEELKPEAVYFYAPNGCRGGMMVLNLDDSSQLPSVAEPFFLKFGAKCEVHVAMSPEDIGKAGLEELGKKWA